MTFWSIYVIALTAITLIASTWLLWVTSKKRSSGDIQSSTETTGHVWDGDLTEYNKPLPRWWINLFYLTIVFAIGYLIWYPRRCMHGSMARESRSSRAIRKLWSPANRFFPITVQFVMARMPAAQSAFLNSPTLSGSSMVRRTAS